MNKLCRYAVIILLCASIAGCAGMQRKFARKKQKEEKPLPVVTTYDYAKEQRVDELYKKRFLFWKSWQGELIDRIGDTYKKRTECYDELMQNLTEMQKYLNDEKYKELEVFITEVKSVDLDVKKIDLRGSEQYRISQLLEKTKRLIDKRFSYNKVKDFLELRK
jgi:dsDNA-binding SOS-regulon protein